VNDGDVRTVRELAVDGGNAPQLPQERGGAVRAGQAMDVPAWDEDMREVLAGRRCGSAAAQGGDQGRAGGSDSTAYSERI
jgi:hypothetical protein